MSRLALYSFRAERELERFAQEYEQKQPGLGLRFERSVLQLVRTLTRQPYLYAKHKRNLRIAKIHRFPFIIFYVVRRNFIEIAAILPSGMNPQNWPVKP